MIDRFHHPDKYKTEEELAAENPPTFAELFDEFLKKHSLLEVRKKNFRVAKRALMRYRKTRIWFRRHQGITRTFAVIEKKTAVLNGHT